MLGTLPVRFHSSAGEVVAAGVSGRDIPVPSGRFYLGVTLPNGREVIGARVIDTRADAVPPLPTLEDEIAMSFDFSAFASMPMAVGAAPPMADFAQPRSMTIELPSDQPAAPSPRPAASSAMACLWEGDWIGAWGRIVAPDVPRPCGEATIEIATTPRLLPRGSALDALLAITIGDRQRLFVMPHDRASDDPATPCGILAQLLEDGQNIAFSSPISLETNALLEFVEQSLVSESRRLSIDFIEHADEAVEAGSSLLRLLFGVYVLLRANELEHLDDRVCRLLAVQIDCPDALVLRAEILARQGRHDEAIAVLRTTCGAGCPWLRSGVGYLLDRLKLYLSVGAIGEQVSAPEGYQASEVESASAARSIDFRLSDGDAALFDQHRAQMERMVSRIDNSRLFTTFSLDLGGICKTG